MTATVETTEDILEGVSELVNDTSQLVEDTISWASRNSKIVGLSAGLVGIALGISVGVYLTNRRLREKYQAIANEQIEDVRRHYASVHKKPGVEELHRRAEEIREREQQVKTTREISEVNGYVAYDKVTPSKEAEAEHAPQEPTAEDLSENVFGEDLADAFDPEIEAVRREEHPDKPYVLTREEFDDGDLEYEQLTLTYFDGDNVLVDSEQRQIREFDEVVGVENMVRFGHGSEDPNVVYIRNNRLAADYEVLFDPGFYSVKVLGYSNEEVEQAHLRHSEIRRFRPHHDE